MRNLTLLWETHKSLFPGGCADEKYPSKMALDPDTGNIYAATLDGDALAILQISSSSTIQELVQLPDKNGTTSIQDLRLVGFQFLPDSDALCIAFASGELFLIHLAESIPNVEPVGIIDSGIRSMEWSPDSELVILITGQGTLLEMTRDLDIIVEFPIQMDEHGQARPVSVGWGKKETQFHGSEGKQAALRKVEQSSNMLSDADDHLPRISWRGDGAYFCCSSVDENNNKRTIRVYNREGVLQNTSEPVPGLEHALSWRPSGNLIATTVLQNQKRQVAFFERNGLRHGEFALAFINQIVEELSWNCDSSFLAITIKQGIKSTIQLRTSENYHWYLKQELCLESEDLSFVHSVWDAENPLLLHALCSDGTLRSYQFSTDICASSSLSELNQGVVTVIDGLDIQCTPFKTRNVPPPMSFSKFSTSSVTKHISFGPDVNGSSVAVLLSNGTVQTWNNVDQISAKIHSSAQFSVGSPTSISRQIAWIEEHKILVLEYDTKSSTDKLYIYDFSSTEQVIKSAVTTNRFACIGKIMHFTAYNKTLVETNDGIVLEVVLDGNSITVEERHTFASFCQWFAYAQTMDKKADLWFGLTERNKLYLGDRILSSEATSFWTHSDFLVFTTLSQFAHFVPLSGEEEDIKVKDLSAASKEQGSSTTSEYDESIRAIERGAKIVIAIPNDVQLVLQMPRGNLETVAPRALVLSKIRHYIDNLEYRPAFILARKHRIDMNFLVDYQQELFKASVEEFIRQVREVEYMNLLITSLKNEDTTKTIYRGINAPPAKDTVPISDKSAKLPTKVNSLCDLLRDALIKTDEKKYINSILTADAKKSPPALEDAMRRILHVRETISVEAAESALMYLIFLADVDRLYDVALGMYDFQLVLMVAQHSQKDPREYLTFLSDLQKLEKNYQRYKIDDHLGRKELALKNLTMAGDDKFTEVLSYMKRNTLYQTALELYEPGCAQAKEIMNAFAEHLETFGSSDDAGVLYEGAGEFEKAIDAYTNAGLWKEATGLIRQLGFDADKTRGIGSALYDVLVEQRRYADAAAVAIDLMKDPRKQIQTLLEGYLWPDALCSIRIHKLDELVDSMLKPALLARAKHIEDELFTWNETFVKQHLRLKEVRSEKLRLIEAAANFEEIDERLNDIDMFSDTASMATTRVTGSVISRMSAMSSRTGRTSKTRRKMARRRAAGKDAAFEDEFLLDSMSKTINTTNQMRNDLKLLSQALAVHGFWAQGRAIQNAFKTLLATIEERLDAFQDPSAIEKKDPSTATPEEQLQAQKPVLIYKSAPPVSSDTWYTEVFSH